MWPCLSSLLLGTKGGSGWDGEKSTAWNSRRGPVPACSLSRGSEPGNSTPGFSYQELGSFLSPSSLTEVYAQLCNVARIEAEREAGVHFRPGYEYGPGPEDLHYGLYGPEGAPFYNYLGPEDTIPEPPFPNTASRAGDHTPVLESPLQPAELQPHYVASQPGLCCCPDGEAVGPAAVSLPPPLPTRRVRPWRGGGGRPTRPSHSSLKGQLQMPGSDPNDSDNWHRGHKEGTTSTSKASLRELRERKQEHSSLLRPPRHSQ